MLFKMKKLKPFLHFFVIKLKQICNTGRVSLRTKTKTNHEVKKIVKFGSNNQSVVFHEDTDLDLQEAETEEVVNDSEIDKDESIFDILLCTRDRFINQYV